MFSRRNREVEVKEEVNQSKGVVIVHIVNNLVYLYIEKEGAADAYDMENSGLYILNEKDTEREIGISGNIIFVETHSSDREKMIEEVKEYLHLDSLSNVHYIYIDIEYI